MSRNITELRQINNHRYDYSKISGDLPLPNLVEIQTKSYAEFLEKGLDEVFRESFPIENYIGTLTIEYLSIRLGEPKHSYLECKEKDLTYNVPMYITVRLIHKETGEIQESEVFMGDLPLMTSSGTFIVNGAERVIVSQIVRSPGAYISSEMDKNGKMVYNADLIPTRGTWLEFETDPKGIISVRIDRQKKMAATIILKALGLDNEKILHKLFGKNALLDATID